MNNEEVEEWAGKNNLDVRPMQKSGNHIIMMRLMDERGNYIMDVYFKRNKGKTRILKNSVFIHKKEIWTTADSTQELSKLIN